MYIKRTQIVLAVTAIPLVAVAAYCLSWYDLRVVRLVTVADGRVFGVVNGTGSRYFDEVRCWSADLSRETVINAGARIIDDIDVTPSGDLLAVDFNGGLRMIDVQTGNILWTAKGDRNGSFHSLLSFVGDAKYVAVGKYDGHQKADRVRVYRAADGLLIGEINEQKLTVHNDIQSRGDRFAYLNLNQELVVVDLAGGEVQETARVPGVDDFQIERDGSITLLAAGKKRVLDAGGAIIHLDSVASESGAAAASAPDRPQPDWTVKHRSDLLVATNNATRSSRTRRLQPMRWGDMVFVLLGLSGGVAVWTIALLRDGVRSQRSWRVAADLVIVCVVLHSMWWALPRAFWENVGIFWVLLIGCGAFLATLGLRNTPRHRGVMLAGILLLPLTLPVLLALIMRQFRWRLRGSHDTADQEVAAAEPAPGTGQRQFTLRDLFLATAAIAAMLGLARILIAWNLLFDFVGLLAVLGGGLALLVGFSRLGARVTWGLFAVSVFMMVFASVGKFIGGRAATEMILCASVPSWLLMHLRCHGYVIRRIAPGDG